MDRYGGWLWISRIRGDIYCGVWGLLFFPGIYSGLALRFSCRIVSVGGDSLEKERGALRLREVGSCRRIWVIKCEARFMCAGGFFLFFYIHTHLFVER